jgi:hypothetical protein
MGPFRWFALSAVVLSPLVMAGCGDNASITGGTIQHWDGVTWTLSTSTGGANNRYLRGVWGSGPDDVWAVGLGMVLHNDGSTWSPVIRRDDEGAFRSVWGSGSNDVWIAGKELLHWNGTGWASVEVPEGLGAVVSGWSAGPDDAWAITSIFIDAGAPPGRLTAPAVLRWNGSTWTIAWRGDERDRDSLGAIWGNASGEVWAAGIRGDGDHAVVVRWNGSTWSTTGLHVDSATQMWGSGPNDVWLVGGDQRPLHWDGATWSPIDDVPEATWTVWGSGPNDVWIFGSFGGGIHWNGAEWSRRPAPTTHGLTNAAWGSGPNDVWAVGGIAD